MKAEVEKLKAIFQSTPPVKAATVYVLGTAELTEISIHAAREGGDTVLRSTTSGGYSFQSTPPVKAATPPVRARFKGGCYFNPRRP